MLPQTFVRMGRLALLQMGLRQTLALVPAGQVGVALRILVCTATPQRVPALAPHNYHVLTQKA